MGLIKIELQDHIHKHIKEKSYLKLKWILGLFNYIIEDYEDDYVIVEGTKFFIKDGEDVLLITDKYKSSLVESTDEIEITPDILPNITKKEVTTMGRLLFNCLIGVECFNGKIPYINEEFDLSYIENMFISNMLEKKDLETYITTEEYLNFIDMRLFIDTLTNFLTLGVTEHSIRKAPGIDKFKSEKIKELEVKYKEKPLKTALAIAELEDSLKQYDIAYLKQDKSYGKMITKKVTNMARKRMYGIYGIGNDVTGKATPIMIALSDGYNKDPETLAAMFNDVIGGSMGRGDETKDAGVLTKYLTRSTADIVIDHTDCKTKIYLKTVITKDNTEELLGRFIKVGNTMTMLTTDSITTYLNKEVELRDPLYCKSDTGLCMTCAGNKLLGYEKTIPLLAVDLGGFNLDLKLKKFHGTELKITKLTLDELT